MNQPNHLPAAPETKSVPILFRLPQIAKAVGLPTRTVEARIASVCLEPDALLVVDSDRVEPLFEADTLTQIRQACRAKGRKQ